MRPAAFEVSMPSLSDRNTISRSSSTKRWCPVPTSRARSVTGHVSWRVIRLPRRGVAGHGAGGSLIRIVDVVGRDHSDRDVGGNVGAAADSDVPTADRPADSATDRRLDDGETRKDGDGAETCGEGLEAHGVMLPLSEYISSEQAALFIGRLCTLNTRWPLNWINSLAAQVEGGPNDGTGDGISDGYGGTTTYPVTVPIRPAT